MADKEKMSKIGKSNVRRSKSHERRIAHLLTDWTGAEFRRRRVEGRDLSVVERESTADVIPVKESIIFSIEAKCGECTSLDGLLKDPRNNKFTKWWHQATYDANILTDALKRKIYPLLFFKPAPAFDWVAIDKRVVDDGILTPTSDCEIRRTMANEKGQKAWFNNIALDLYATMGPIEHNVSHSKRNNVMVSIELSPVYLVRWQDVISSIDPASIFVKNTVEV